MNSKEAIRQLESLIEHPGWLYLKSNLEASMLVAARNIASARAMSAQDIDFQRGAIWAADRLIGTPQTLIQVLKNEVILEEAKRIARVPAKDDA